MPRALGVSIVIPVRNEAHSLRALWSSVHEQTLAPDEVVIVDGGSDDGTVLVARQLAARDGRLRLIEAGRASPGRARNVGIDAARNDWIALTDAGIELDPTWLENLVAAAQRNPSAGVVYGHYDPLMRTFFERCAALAYVAVARDTPAGRMRGPSVASALVHRSAWKAAGGFPDFRAGEDLSFMSRLEAVGIEAAWAPSAVARWELRPSLAATFRRFYVYSSQSVLGEQHRDWHYAVLRNYLLAAPFVGLAVRNRDWRWATPPLMGAFGRIGRSIWRRREGRSLLWAIHPLQFAGVGVVIATIDLATFLGWAHALLRRLRTTRAAGQEAPLNEACRRQLRSGPSQ